MRRATSRIVSSRGPCMTERMNGHKPSFQDDGAKNAIAKGGGIVTRPRFWTAICVAAFFGLAAGGVASVWWMQHLYAGTTQAEYLAKAGPNARTVAAGALQFDGESFACGRFPAIFNAGLDDYGAAHFGFILLNPARFQTLPPILKRYAY